jgi:hypothetical protein
LNPISRGLLILEVLVCFGPGVAFLAVGVLMLPVWVGMLGFAVFDAEYRDTVSGVEHLSVVASILAVIGGLIGLLGLLRVLSFLMNPLTTATLTTRTRLYVLIGVATPVLVAGAFFWRDIRPLVFLCVLPIFASAHIIYLARKALFPHESPSTPVA